MITINQFNEIEIRVGLVTAAENVEKSEKLIRLHVNFDPTSLEASKDSRIIFTGVRTYGYTPEDFVGKKWLFVTNLEYRKMPSYVKTPAGKMAEDSQGMILAVDGEEGKPVFISAEGLPVGSKVR